MPVAGIFAWEVSSNDQMTLLLPFAPQPYQIDTLSHSCFDLLFDQ